MSMREEFDRMRELFQSAAEGKQANLESVFKEALKFFEMLKEQLAKGSAEDKAEAMRMMTQMYQHMIADTKKITERSGMSEEQLAAFAENPSNFTKEQWEALQNSRAQIKTVGQDLAKSLETGPSGPKPSSTHPQKKGLEPKIKRSDWMRS